MFKVPDWEDTLSNNLNFTNVLPKKNKQKSKKTKIPEMPKQVVQAKPRFKAKTISTSKIKLMNQVQNPNKTEKKQKYKTNTKQKQEYKLKKQKNGSKNLVKIKKGSDNNIKIKNYDSEKLDELVLDVKKQRFDTHKNDDNEEILFQESPEKIITNNKNNIHSNKTTNNIKTNNSITKTSVKSEHKLGLSKVVNKSHIIIKDKVKTTKKNDPDNVIKSKEIGKTVKLKDLRKKEALKSVLQKESSRNHINVSGNKLRNRMLDRLKAAQFRYLNEKLYTSSGSDAQKLFQGDPSAFQTYHEGYQQQVKKWPVKPLDVIVKRIQKMPQTHTIADMGCGEAELSKRVAQQVRSFDLVATAPGVEACDMAHTPLLARSVDVVVYCLALMGTDLTQYLLEANRVLKSGGHLLIAEVESRFDNIQAFTSDVQRLGFSLKKSDDTHKVFYFLEFTKLRDPPVKKSKLPMLTLKPCIYKKR